MLQEVKVPIMENSVCQEMFQTAGHQKLIIDSFMCAGYANGQKDSCEVLIRFPFSNRDKVRLIIPMTLDDIASGSSAHIHKPVIPESRL